MPSVIVRKLNVERGDVREWLAALEKARQDKRKPVYDRIHELVAVPSRRRVSVDVYKISSSTKEGDTVVVPGKVLGVGAMSHSVSIAALGFSASALKSLKDANCRIITIKDVLGAAKLRIIV